MTLLSYLFKSSIIATPEGSHGMTVLMKLHVRKFQGSATLSQHEDSSTEKVQL